jgi:hypothetical protein
MEEMEEKTGDTVAGNFGENMVNDNGESLIVLCTQTSLKIWNGFFNHRSIHKYTWEEHTKEHENYYSLHTKKTRFKTEITGC